jgi:GGDEF domain-containing protein
VSGHGAAYRFGGDEFCVLVDVNNRELVDSLHSLLERGPPTAACGTCQLPFEVTELDDATVLADRRMYDRKPGRRSTDEGERAAESASLAEQGSRQQMVSDTIC